MKQLIKLLIPALFILHFGLASAQTASYPPQKIKKVLQYNSFVVIELEAEQNSQGCTRNSSGAQQRIGFTTRSDDGKVLLANLLTAYAGDKNIVAGVNGCMPYSTVTIPRVYRLELLTN